MRRFITHAEACEHTAQEYDGDLPADHKRQIIRSMRKYCGAARRQLDVLRHRYRHDPRLLDLINNHANEPMLDYEEARAARAK